MKSGFTLVELLVVVLIIGVLTAVALPMYQGVVDKSHWSTMLPAAKALKDAEEAFKMANGEYTETMENLDVTMNNEAITFDLQTPNGITQPDVIKVTNSKLNNVRLASYLDGSPLMSGQLHCEALKNDERAKRLCEKLLGGDELKETGDGYIGYLLNQTVTGEICKNASGSWSTSKTKCFKTTAERCEALNMPAIDGKDMCGYENIYGDWFSVAIEEEGVCLSTSRACAQTVIKSGAICEVQGNESGCENIGLHKGGICIDNGGGGCTSGHAGPLKGAVICNSPRGYCAYTSTFDGGICIANGGNCYYGKFNNNSICYSIQPSTCDRGTYDDTSCCCGDYCGGKPKCSDTRCAEAIAPYTQYLK